MEKTPYEKLMEYSLKLLARKRYTVYELQGKVKMKVRKAKLKIEQQEIDRMFARLVELGYLNDEGFARDYVADRMKFKPRGRHLIRNELKVKGVDMEMVEKAFVENKFDEEELAIFALKKRLKVLEKGKFAKDKRKQRSKAYAFLASRGFCLDAIYKALDTCYGQL